MTSTEIAAADKIMLGATEAEAMYIGSTLIWQKVIEAPYDMELEYLESTGTQYINTGIINNSSVIVDMKMSASGTNCLHGSEYTYQYRFKWGADGNGRVYYGYLNNHTSNVTFLLDQPCTYHLKQGEQYVKDYLGNTILSSSETLSTYSTNPIMLFKCYSGSDWVNTSGTTRIYNCKIYNNGVLMDLIPVRKGLVGYLYDKVSGQLFGNSGTGNFVLGPDIILVEYLEATGTQHIITDLYGTLDFRFEVKVNFSTKNSPEDNASATIIGSRESYNSKGFLLSSFNDSTVLFGSALNVQVNSITLNTDYVYKFIGDTVYVNGTATKQININYTFTTPNPLLLFALYNNGTITEHLRGKIYYVKIFNNTTLETIAEFIPVRAGQVGYMYDKVSGLLYGNAGTGSFTLGPDKLINN